jgi:hypothetical protein
MGEGNSREKPMPTTSPKVHEVLLGSVVTFLNEREREREIEREES